MFTLTSLSRQTATNHPNSLIPRLRLSRWISWASPLSRRLAALFRPNRVHFRCGLSDSFHCSPPRLATTQLSQVSAGVRAPTAQGLSPCRVVTLHSAREVRLSLTHLKTLKNQSRIHKPLAIKVHCIYPRTAPKKNDRYQMTNSQYRSLYQPTKSLY